MSSPTVHEPPFAGALTSPLTAIATSPAIPSPSPRDYETSPLSPASSSSNPELLVSSPEILASSPEIQNLTARQQRRRRKRRRRQSPEDKVRTIMKELHDMRWDLKDFLSALCENRSSPNLRVASRQFFDYTYTELPQHSDFDGFVGNKVLERIFVARGWAWATEILRLEIEALGKHDAFGMFNPPSEAADLGSLESIKNAVSAIERLAPQWLKVVQASTYETRPRVAREAVADSPVDSSLTRRSVHIFATLCHLMRPNRSTNFQTVMGLYLYQGGARRRVLDTLCQFGLISSYTTLQRRMKGLVAEAERRVALVGKAPSTILTWDNFEFTEGRRGERTGDHATFRSITTALIVQGVGFDHQPLQQYMWRPKASLLSTERLIRKMIQSEYTHTIRLHHVESAIRSLFDTNLTGVQFPWSTNMPVLNKLEPRKTIHFPLKPVMKDESTTSNNIQIIEDIYGRQFKMKDDDPAFETILRLVGGDLKTWSRIQSAKRLRGSISEHPFDRFGWLLPSIGLWHLRLNMLQLIHRTHWGVVKPADPSTLQYAADRWGRARVVEPNDFQAIEDLIIHSYQARVVGHWLRLARREKINPRRIEEIIPWLTAQTPGESGSWLRMLTRIVNLTEAPVPTGPPETETPIRDEQFHNHQKYCSHVEAYLTLRYSIKHADIGLLRLALRQVTILFQAPAAHAPKYAQALLYVYHLVDSPAASIKLQDCVLTNSLVNLRGSTDSNFELDRLLELLNNNLKAFQQERSYYSKYSDTLLEHWALNGPYLLALKDLLESTFGKPNSGTHPVKSAAEDIWSMALNLASKSLIQYRNEDRFSFNPAADLATEGLHKLGENVLKYNQQYASGVNSDVDDDGDDGVDELEVGLTNNLGASRAQGSPILSSTILEDFDMPFVD